MKYALVNGKKTEAVKGIKGICQVCELELIPKCGDIMIHHWAHKVNRICDQWWDTETEWHRTWKNKFPTEWQEACFRDKMTGERHIADIHTNDGLVIEFQHSSISPQERKSREDFYDDMIWVVDGTRLKRDYNRFLKGIKYFRSGEKDKIYTIEHPENVFPASWLNCTAPVIFDFKGLSFIEDIDDKRHLLFCLLHERVENIVFLIELSRTAFIKSILEGNWNTRLKKFIDEFIKPRQIERQNLRFYLELKESLNRRRVPPNIFRRRNNL